MQTHKLLNDNNISLDFNLNKCLGHGADGSAFQIDEQRVLKLSVLFDWCDNLKQDFRKVSDSLLYLINHGCLGFGKVFEYKYIGFFSRSNGIEIQNYIMYYYVMEKLDPISPDEKRVFHTIISHQDSNQVKSFSVKELKDTLNGLSYSLDFDSNKVKAFYENLLQSPLKHNDIEPRNIMKNKSGDFLMIDFNRCTLKGK